MVNSKQSELILNGKLSKAIWFLAIPATINFFLEQFFQIIDIFWISKLGEDAIASMAVWTFLAWSLISSAQIVEIGVNSLVAKSWGAKDFDRAKSIANVGFHLILVVTIFVSLLTMAFSENLMNFMGLSEGVKILAFKYLDLMLSGFPFLGLIFVISAIFRGTGDTVTPLKLLAIVILINLVLDPLLILGYFGFPKMGIFGAAVAT
ncbi:polysaccharide biosynthesis C-terminal domain-containing protein, partial [bacterium]|nr:polysaccharide biosynthesis C-terminal domain-containing protein [bacterium]